MTLVLEEVKSNNDFDEIVKVLHVAFGQPYNSLRQWFIPVQTTTEAALEESKGRLLKGWKQNKDVHWLKVTDTNTGDIVAAAEWEVRQKIEKPSGEPKPFDAFWHIEGSEEKKFAEQILSQFRAFKTARMDRPHLGMEFVAFRLQGLIGIPELGQIVVHPDYREQGVGRLLMNWGIGKADELGLESCVQSVPFAVPLYEKCGYANLEALDPDMSVPNPSKKWQEWVSEDLRTYLMWRPAGRNYQQGTDKASWLNA